MIYVASALLAGVVLSLQALLNARLGASLGAPLWATMASLIVGFVSVMTILIVSRAPLPPLSAMTALPVWAWCGGAFGAVYLLGVIFSVGGLGVASTVALVVFGQMAASLVLDHFGVLLPQPHMMTPLRLLGASLLLVGVILIKTF